MPILTGSQLGDLDDYFRKWAEDVVKPYFSGTLDQDQIADLFVLLSSALLAKRDLLLGGDLVPMIKFFGEVIKRDPGDTEAKRLYDMLVLVSTSSTDS